MSSKIKVAMIGVGGIANAHWNGWSALADRAEVVALCDLSPDQVKKRSEEWKVTRTFTDFNRMLKEVDCDAVDVCTPNKAHTPAVIAALRAGRHVLCEKPLAATPAEIEQMIKARDKAKKLLMTAQHMRFEGASMLLKKAIDDGELGSVYHARSWFLRRRRLPARPGFYVNKLSGGGPCIDIGVHTLDLTLHFMGFPEPALVVGTTPCKLAKKPGIYNEWAGWSTQDWRKTYDVEDFAAGFVKFKNGASLILEVSWMLNLRENEIFRINLFGERAGCEYPGLEVFGEENGRQFDKKLTNPPQLKGHANEIAHFVKALEDGAKASPVPAEQSLIVQKILDGMYRSHKTGQAVKL